MVSSSCVRLWLLLCVLYFVLNSTQGTHGHHHHRHRHHEKRYFDDTHHAHSGYHSHSNGHHNSHNRRNAHQRPQTYSAQNDILEKSLTRKRASWVPVGSRWSSTFLGVGQESSSNNTVLNVTAQVGRAAFLPCRVGHLGDRQISWIRRRDWHVLTSADAIYTHDPRFSVLHEQGSQDWTLHIKYASVRDNGTYECQVSTGTGIISKFVNLAIVTPEARIPGEGQYHIYTGSPFSLTCLIAKSPTPPQYVHWYHNGTLLNYVRGRPELTISTEIRDGNSDTSVSRLEVASAEYIHSGNYTCSARNTKSATTMVFVTEGDKTAAVQRIDSGSRRVGEEGVAALLKVAMSVIVLLEYFIVFR